MSRMPISSQSAFSAEELVQQTRLATTLVMVGAWVWLGLVVLQVRTFWSGPETVAEAFGVPPIPFSAYYSGLFVIGVSLGLSVAVVIRVLGLMRLYRRGDIFTIAAAESLHRLAMAGLVASLGDFFARLVSIFVVTMHAPNGPFIIWVPGPDHILNLLMVGFLFALAHVFRAAARLADDNAAIV